MKTLTFIVVAGVLAGCASHRPALVVEVNGRRVEFQAFREGKIPRGMEVSHFDPSNLRVQGETPIVVNGLTILAQGDEFTIGGRSFRVDRDSQVVVLEDNRIEVRMNSRAGAPAVPTPSDAPKADPAAGFVGPPPPKK